MRLAPIAAVLLAGAFVTLALIILPRYGPTFDAVLGDYAYGEYLLEFARTGDARYLSFHEGELPYYDHAGHPHWKLVYPPKWVYPVPALLSAASCLLFARTLGWLEPIDAHHLICPLAIAALLLLWYRFIAARAGAATGLATVLALLLYPRFFGHAINNIKDAPTLLIVYAALLAWIRALETERGAPVLLGAILTGIGFATKINAVWPIAFFVMVFFGSRLPRLARGAPTPLRFAAALLLAPALVIAAYLAASPILWLDGFTRFAEHARYALIESVRVEGRDAFSWEPLQNLFWVTPPLYLPLAVVGGFSLLRRRCLRGPVAWMLGLMLVVPILRPCFPAMRYFNIIRHSLEVIPVLALLVGAGASTLLEHAMRRCRGRGAMRFAVGSLLGAALAAPQVVTMVRIHPYQTTYFNTFAGGLGARQRQNHLDANDYWCQSYREGLRWINANADPGALLLVPVAPWMVGAGREVWLRPDLSFTEDDEAVRAMIAAGLLDPARDRAAWSRIKSVYVMFVPLSKRYNLPPHSAVVRFCEQQLTPIHRIEADGGVILSIYRFEP